MQGNAEAGGKDKTTGEHVRPRFDQFLGHLVAQHPALGIPPTEGHGARGGGGVSDEFLLAVVTFLDKCLGHVGKGEG